MQNTHGFLSKDFKGKFTFRHKNATLQDTHWLTTQEDKRSLAPLERKVLNRIYGPVCGGQNNNREVYGLPKKLDITKVIKIRRPRRGMKRTCRHFLRMPMVFTSDIYNFFFLNTHVYCQIHWRVLFIGGYPISARAQ